MSKRIPLTYQLVLILFLSSNTTNYYPLAMAMIHVRNFNSSFSLPNFSYEEEQSARFMASYKTQAPPAMSIEIRFQSGDILNKRILHQNIGLEPLSPDFTVVKIYCDSPYPKRWNFSTNLGKEDNIKDWNIQKLRLVHGNSILDSSTTFTFSTDLELKFDERKQFPLQYIFACEHVEARNGIFAHLSAYVTLNSDNFGLNVTLMNGQPPTSKAGRYGRNKNCALKLHIDRESKLYGCSRSSESTSKGGEITELISANIIPCANNDDCGSLLRTNTKCVDAIVDTCAGAQCSNSFEKRTKSGIFLCEVGEEGTKDYNSIGATFYFTTVEPKRLYLIKDPVNVSEVLALQVLNDTTEVYSEGSFSSLLFTCNGSASYFSQGFYWILEYENGSVIQLASNPNYAHYVQSTEIYSTTEEISNFYVNRSQNITLYCVAPRWNSYSWGNVSLTIQFIAGKSPMDELNEEAATKRTQIKRAIIFSVIVVLTILILLIIFIALLIFYLRKRRSNLLETLTPEEIDEFLHGDPQIHHDDDALFYPYNTEYEVGRSQFTIESKVLGDGQFGRVVKGRIGKAPIAIKTIKKFASLLYLKALLSELKIMSHVGRHDFIVNLIGACTENIAKREVFLLVEFCENGNLLAYLKSRRDTFVNYFNDMPGCGRGGSAGATMFRHASGNAKHKSIVLYQNASVKKLSTRDLIGWSYQIASGMEYLSDKNVIHGDLACRNILLTSNLTAKVSDFGLSKQLFDYSIYVQRIECPLPLRWMAIESLRDLEFSKESDIWSYGITCWEIFSLGQLPYPALQWDFESWKLIRDGLRTDKPDFASNEIYQLMLDCWNLKPELRPSFTTLKDQFIEFSLKMDPECQELGFSRRQRADVTRL